MTNKTSKEDNAWNYSSISYFIPNYKVFPAWLLLLSSFLARTSQICRCSIKVLFVCNWHTASIMSFLGVTGIWPIQALKKSQYNQIFLTILFPFNPPSYLLPKSRTVKFLFRSSFGDLKKNLCPTGGRSLSTALTVWITWSWSKQTENLLNTPHVVVLRNVSFLFQFIKHHILPVCINIHYQSKVWTHLLI